MNCTLVREQLALFIYGDLSGDEAAAIEGHLLECPDCRAERAALEQTSQLLDLAPPVEVAIDAPRLIGMAESRAAGRRQWQRIGVFTALAASLIGIALVNLEIRIGGGAMTIRWGAPAAAVQLPVARVADATDASLEERVQLLQELTRALAADVADRDSARQRETAALTSRVDSLSRLTAGGFRNAERDVDALYAAQFKPSREGANP